MKFENITSESGDIAYCTGSSTRGEITYCTSSSMRISFSYHQNVKNIDDFIVIWLFYELKTSVKLDIHNWSSENNWKNTIYKLCYIKGVDLTQLFK
jgi:hypothetical protein